MWVSWWSPCGSHWVLYGRSSPHSNWWLTSSHRLLRSPRYVHRYRTVSRLLQWIPSGSVLKEKQTKKLITRLFQHFAFHNRCHIIVRSLSGPKELLRSRMTNNCLLFWYEKPADKCSHLDVWQIHFSLCLFNIYVWLKVLPLIAPCDPHGCMNMPSPYAGRTYKATKHGFIFMFIFCCISWFVNACLLIVLEP